MAIFQGLNTDLEKKLEVCWTNGVGTRGEPAGDSGTQPRRKCGRVEGLLRLHLS